jgi:hypothetical protein
MINEARIIPAQDEYIDPKACEADVEMDLSDEMRGVARATTQMNCGRCGIRRFLNDSYGTQLEIKVDVSAQVAGVVFVNCGKLRGIQNPPPELMPRPRVL